MKKFWQSIKIWQKALVLLFVVLFIIFHAVFLCSVNFLAQDALMCKDRNMFKSVNIFKTEKDIEIQTTKKEYAKGEEIKVILKNNLDEEIFLYGISVTTQLIDYYGENGNREIADIADVDVRLDINCECLKECRYVAKIMPKEQKEFTWDQRNDSGNQVEGGAYRLSAVLGAWDKSVLIYSNEFMIGNIQKEGLLITTDKTRHKQGEKITGKIQNNFKQEAVFYTISIVAPIEVFYEEGGGEYWAEKEKTSWEEVRYDIGCPCGAKCSRALIELAPGESQNFSGDLKNNSCEDLPAGNYKIKIDWQTVDESGYSYSDEFLIVSQEFSECQKDDDCEAEFSNCDCKYHCLNKNNEEEEFEDCDNECKMILHPKPECVCSNNKCVEASNCDKLKLEINDLIDKIKYCEKDSDCELDESYDDTIWPFDCFLIKNKLYGEDYRNLIQEKTNEYLDNDCPYYPLRECPYPPKPEDIKCQNNQCVDARFSSFKESGAQESESIVERLNRLNAQGELTAEDQGWEIEQKCYGLESINDCEKINWPMKCGCRTDGKHECYRCFAELLKNADYCGKIEEEFWMNNCYWAVAVQLRDAGEQDKINFCGKMTGEARSDNQKGACFEIAKEKKLKIDQK